MIRRNTEIWRHPCRKRAEVCRRIAEELGVEVEFVEYATLEAQLQAVTDGDVDLAADNFMITEERLALYEMTDDFNVREIEGDEVFLSANPQPWLPSEEETEESSSETEDEASRRARTQRDDTE